MGKFVDCYVVVRSTQDDDGDAPIECIMAVFPDEEEAKKYIEECYGDDFDEFVDRDIEYTYEEYKECPVNYYLYTKKPMFVKTSDSYQRVNINGGTTVSSVTETVQRD